MHRSLSKSLRHVGKLNEGYLSDVQNNSFSNMQYDSDASSDLMESTKVLEKQFKDKYMILRNAYEKRIQHLTSSVEAVCAQLMSDEYIASMKTDAASSVYIPAHISETLASYLKSERENVIQELFERESALTAQLNRKTATIDNLNRKIMHLDEESSKGQATEKTMVDLQDKLRTLEKQYSSYSQQSQEEINELKREKEMDKMTVKSLKEDYEKCQEELKAKKIELDRLRTDNSVKAREVFELEKSIQLTGKDITHLSESESRQKIELEQCSQKLKRTADQRDSLAADVQRLTEKLRYNSEDLEKAQAAHENLLREKAKYQQNIDDAIARTKRAASEEVAEAQENLSLANKKIKNLTEKFELDLEREKYATQTYKDEAAISKAMIEEKQKEIKTLNADNASSRETIDSLHDKLTNVREILEDTNVQLLRAKNSSKEWQNRAYEAENRVNALVHSHKKEKKDFEEQVQSDMEKRLEAERRQLESRSDMFRMHYQNQMLDLNISRSNMSLSRSMTALPTNSDPKWNKVYESRNSNSSHQVQDNASHFANDSSHHHHHHHRHPLVSTSTGIDERVDLPSHAVSIHPQNHHHHQEHQHQNTDNKQFQSQSDQSIISRLTNENASLQEELDKSSKEARLTQLKLQQAAETIERMKELLKDSQSSVSKHKATIRDQQNKIAELEHDQMLRRKSTEVPPPPPPMSSPSDMMVDTERQVVGISKVRKLEAEISRLQTVLSQTQEQAREDHEQDAALLESMQQKFESLVKNFDDNKSEQKENLMKKEREVETLKEENASLKIANEKLEEDAEELQYQVNTMVDFNSELEAKHEEEMNALAKELSHCKEHAKKSTETSESLNRDFVALRSELDKRCSEAQLSENNLTEEKKLNKELKINNKRLKSILYSIDDVYRQQLRELRIALSNIKDSYALLESGVTNEVERISRECISNIQPKLEKMSREYDEKLQRELQSLSATHMKEESHLIESFHKKVGYTNDPEKEKKKQYGEDDFNRVSSHYEKVIKSILEAMVASSIIESRSAKEFEFFIESANIKSISVDTVGMRETNSIGVVSSKLYEILCRELNKFVNEKENMASQIEILSDDLRKEKIHSSELKMSIQENENNEHASNQYGRVPDSNNFDEEGKVRRLQSRIDELKLRHKMEVDRLKTEWENNESERIKKLEIQIEEGEQMKVDLTTKLRTEQTRRHHLQSRLVSEEADHRSEMEEFEKKFFDLQSRFNTLQYGQR